MRFFIDKCLPPKVLALILLANLSQIEEPLAAGAIVVVLDDRIRVRYLPLDVDTSR